MNRTDKELIDKNIELAFEFSRLILAKPELGEKIPDNALVIFEVEGDAELTAYNKKVAKQGKESNQSIVLVHVKGLAPSRLIQPELRSAANF